MIAGDIYLGQTKGMGRGVFAARHFLKGQVIEVCPLLAIPDYLPKYESGSLDEYVFMVDGEAVLALGYGSLYNHSSEPNASYRFLKDAVAIRARRQIRKGEQIFIDYGYNEDDLKRSWKRFAHSYHER